MASSFVHAMIWPFIVTNVKSKPKTLMDFTIFVSARIGKFDEMFTMNLCRAANLYLYTSSEWRKQQKNKNLH